MNLSDDDVIAEYHLKVYANRSELIAHNGTETVFVEGPNNAATNKRYKKITDALENGFLREQIRLCREEPQKLLIDRLSEPHQQILDGLVKAMTSEVGRALVGLAVLQITVKAIEPTQSIRLHKGGSSSRTFSWRDGISMRSLDSKYITPLLRGEELVKLNSFGFMMTRTLAENYPYTRVYKAAMRGAREEWLNLVEGLETAAIQPLPALQYILAQLLNNAAKFAELADGTLSILKRLFAKGAFDTIDSVTALIRQHMAVSNYAARIMEISMHALMQSIEEVGALGSATVIPLSQMRSANKKHGNIGDIELMDGAKIIESWDAKYGKTYLRDELEELNDKIILHDAVTEAGFVTSEEPQLLPEIAERIMELEEINGIKIRILTLDSWVTDQVTRAIKAVEVNEEKLARLWLIAYVESLAQKRPAQAPIDEPCFQWLNSLHNLLIKIDK